MYTVGVIGHLIPATRGLMLMLTPFSLLLTGSVVLADWLLRHRNEGAHLPLMVWFIAAYCFTFFVEVIGVKTGLVFGAYTYGDVLGWKVLDTPLIIGFNWVLVVAGSYSRAVTLVRNRYLTPLLTGAIALVFDLVLEQIAIRLGYWHWTGGDIPLQNYVAWFVLAALLSFPLEKIVRVRHTIPFLYVEIQFLFFVILLLWM